MSAEAPSVLLTGASGRLARAIRPMLAASCGELRLTDRLPIELQGDNESAHVLDLAEVTRRPDLLAGIDAVVHLAGYPREADWSTLIAANISATAALWETALAQGVNRMIYASSNHAVGFYPRAVRIGSNALPRPDSRYGVTKVFMEAMASLYAFKHGLRAFGMRIGHCSPAPTDARMLSHWIHPEDLASLILVGLRADYLCEVVYGVSANARSWWNNERADALGYSPRHSADTSADALLGARSDNAVCELYQGGGFAADGYSGDPERAARAR